MLYVHGAKTDFQKAVTPARWAMAALLFRLFFASPGTGADMPVEILGSPDAAECVVVLHGLARTRGSMHKMAQALANAGFRVVNIDYPSRKKSIEDVAAQEVTAGLRCCQESGAHRVHFVTHSLGGIVVREALSRDKPPNLGRVVMLSPPNRGSFVAERLKGWWLYRWLNGPAGQELGTGPDSLPNRLGAVDYEVGGITGNRHAFFDAWFASLSPDANDGKVSVDDARVDGMSDFLVVPESHPFIMKADEVIAQTIYFLRHGRFRRP